MNCVVPLDELDKAALEMAKKIAKTSTLATFLSKRALNQGVYQDFEQVLEQETRDVLLVAMTRESTERAKAALEQTKRK